MLPAYKDLLQSDRSNPHSAYCSTCHKNFDISSMGEGALKSHSLGAKHSALCKQASSTTGRLESFFTSASTSSTSRCPPGTSNSVTNFATKAETLHAEILRTLKCVSAHCSFNSCKDVSDLFAKMFPDYHSQTICMTCNIFYYFRFEKIFFSLGHSVLV